MKKLLLLVIVCVFGCVFSLKKESTNENEIVKGTFNEVVKYKFLS